MTFDQILQKISSLNETEERDFFEKGVKLQEETGEFAAEALKFFGREKITKQGSASKDNLSDEAADMFIVTISYILDGLKAANCPTENLISSILKKLSKWEISQTAQSAPTKDDFNNNCIECGAPIKFIARINFKDMRDIQVSKGEEFEYIGTSSGEYRLYKRISDGKKIVCPHDKKHENGYFIKGTFSGETHDPAVNKYGWAPRIGMKIVEVKPYIIHTIKRIEDNEITLYDSYMDNHRTVGIEELYNSYNYRPFESCDVELKDEDLDNILTDVNEIIQNDGQCQHHGCRECVMKYLGFDTICNHQTTLQRAQEIHSRVVARLEEIKEEEGR